MSTTTEPSTEPRLHTIGAVCERLRCRVPGRLDLEDPVPRGPGPAAAAPHAWRVPPLLGVGRRAARDDPAPPARRVPAAAGDPRRARDAHDRARRSDGGRRSAIPAVRSTRRRSATVRASRRTSRDGSRSTTSSPRGSRQASGSTGRATSRSPQPAAASRTTASTPATCARSERPRTAVRACSSSSSRRGFAPATPQRRRAALDDLQTLAGVAIELAQHLLVRDLREAPSARAAASDVSRTPAQSGKSGR